MEAKKQKANEIYTLIQELNEKTKEANKLGLTVEVRTSYGRGEKYEEPFNCRIGEYVAYGKE